MGEQGDEQEVRHPQKKYYRQRAHCNPLADNFMVHPLSPECIDWELHYPNYYCEEEERGTFRREIHLNTKKYPIKYGEERVDSERSARISGRLKILDIGCGYGGLLVWLSEHFKDKLSLGLEIREKVTNYVGERILSMQQNGTGANISVVKTNAMKYLPNYIARHQLERIFICFPDPHFKKRNWRRRIVSYSTAPLFWYLLQEGGLIYIVTDVYDYFLWALKVMDTYKLLFERVSDKELASDPCVSAIKTTTEEAKKVERSNSPAYSCVYRTIPFGREGFLAE